MVALPTWRKRKAKVSLPSCIVLENFRINLGNFIRKRLTLIKFVSDDGTITTCPAMILGFVQYNITLGIPTPHFTSEEELTLNTIQENMAVDNNLYVVVHTASDYVSSE